MVNNAEKIQEQCDEVTRRGIRDGFLVKWHLEWNINDVKETACCWAGRSLCRQKEKGIEIGVSLMHPKYKNRASGLRWSKPEGDCGEVRLKRKLRVRSYWALEDMVQESGILFGATEAMEEFSEGLGY